MSLRQMEYLVTVVAEGSFTRAAAELLHVTQSALSPQIKALEREVGGPLLERIARGVRLTPMGRAYLHARRTRRTQRRTGPPRRAGVGRGAERRAAHRDGARTRHRRAPGGLCALGA
ncbi:HTH-type transcriptional regulator ArgP [Streptomyces rimosus subsp. rimosus]